MRESDQLRQEALLQALKLLRRGDDPMQVVERLSRCLTNKLLHSPLKKIGA
jgi:glutamyl-tRNA reductase